MRILHLCLFSPVAALAGRVDFFNVAEVLTRRTRKNSIA